MQPDQPKKLRPKKDSPKFHDRGIFEESEDHVEIPHVSEMWLVSYADMMTLLFGLFVLLFAMSTDTKGGMDSKLKEMSEKYFSDASPSKETPAKKIDPQVDVQKLLAELIKLRQIPDQRPLVADLEKKLEALKLLKSAAPDQTQIMLKLQAELQKLQQIPDQRTLVTQLEKQIDELKAQKMLALNQLPKSLKATQSEKVPRLEAQIKDLESQLKQQQRKIASIQENNFMLISITWITEKHDVDLIVTDPDGVRYTFKNKSPKGAIGRLEIDSRYGPGLELWRTKSLKPGDYKIEIQLYNQFGNLKDAEVKTQIVTSKDNLELPPILLNLENKSTSILLHVNEEGKVNVK